MAKKFNFKSKSLWKKIGIGVVAGVVGLGAIMGVGALLNKEEDTTKKITPAYEVGALTEQGDYLESKGSIYTKDAFKCQGLDIEMDFKNDISYRVYFYDGDNDFLSSTEKLTDNYDETTTPLDASYARIVITPNDDDKISWYEVNGYSKQLTISVNKEQVERFNLFEGVAIYEGFWYGYEVKDEPVELVENENDIYSCEFIDISKYNSLDIVLPLIKENEWNSTIVYFTDNSETTIIDYMSLSGASVRGETITHHIEIPDGCTKMSINTIDDYRSEVKIFGNK